MFCVVVMMVLSVSNGMMCLLIWFCKVLCVYDNFVFVVGIVCVKSV